MPSFTTGLSGTAQLELVYIGYFNRAVEASGYNYWANELTARQAGTYPGQTAQTLSAAVLSIARSFSPQAESVALYPFLGITNLSYPVTDLIIKSQITSFVTSVYNNLFGRAPDATGLAYWVDQIAKGEKAGGIGTSNAVLTIADGAGSGTDAQTIKDAAVLTNKIAVSNTFLTSTIAANIGIASPVAQSVIDAAKASLVGVTDVAATVTAATATVTAYVSSYTSTPGQSFSLTTGADAPGAIAPSANTAGTSGNDTYSAADTTLQSTDTIDGGLGTDTLNVRATAAAAVAPVVSSVENINVSNIGGFTYSLNLTSATGLQVAASKDQSSAVGTITDITQLAATGVVARLDNADGTTQFNFVNAAARTGTSDAVSIQIANGSGTSTTAAVLNITDGVAGAGAAADATFENVNITTSGAGSYVNSDLGNTSIRVVNVSGNAAVGTTVRTGGVQDYGLSFDFTTSAAAAVRTVSASGMTGTGGLNIDLTDSTQTTVAFTGSAVNDRVIVDGALANALNTFSLNAGSGGSNDILGADAITDFAAAGQVILRQTVNAATGFESFEATAAVVTALDADQFTSINSFIFSGTQTGGHAITNLRTGDSLTYTIDSTRAADTLTLSGAVAGQSASMTLTGGVDIAATAAGNALTLNSGLTSFAIVSSNVSGLSTTNAVNTIRAATTVEAIDNVSATNFTVSGAAGLTIGAIAGVAAPIGFTQAVNFDASALTGALRIGGSVNADVIKGGSGADIIYSIGGNDELTGNGGADQFRMLASTGGVDTIKDFAVGTDKVGIITGFVDFAGTAGVAAGLNLAATDYEADRGTITDIVVGDTLKVVELQTALTGAQIAAQTAGGVADALVLVFNSTTSKGELWYDADWNTTAARVQLASFDNITSLAGVQSFTNSDFSEYLI